MSAHRLLLVIALATVGACGYDGPSSGVQVVPGESDPSVADGASAAAVGEAAGVGRQLGDESGSPSAAPDGGSVNGSATGEVAIGVEAEAAALSLPSSVAVVGDSLTLSAQDEIETALSALGVEVIAIDGVESRRMTRGGSALPPGTDAVDAIIEAGVLPEVWIVALGTNDVGAEVSASTFADDVAAVMRRIPSGAPVIWVDIWIRDRPDGVDEANRAIRSVVTTRARSVVVDWHAWGAVPDTITGDGVHLTERGQARFATVMADAVASLATD